MMNYSIDGDVTTLIFTKKDGTIVTGQIDTDDLEKVLNFKGSWHAVWNTPGKRFYVQGTLSRSGSNRSAFLHRYITGCQPGLVVDHINHKTTDNRKENLRILQHHENSQNRNGLDSNNKSGYRGVVFIKKTNRWAARVRYKNKNYCFGSYRDIEEAARVVKEKRSEMMKYAE